jgi:mannose-6-phosphate isomerase
MIVKRPWGNFEIIYQNYDMTVTVKRISLNPHSRLSLQYHKHRKEQWTCLSGIATAIIEQRTVRLFPGEHIDVPMEAIHRLCANSGEHGAVVLEVAWGPFDEEDIVRVADDYGRS